MIWKRELTHGAISAVLASVAGVMYSTIYSEALVLDFSQVLGVIDIVVGSSIGCLLMSVGYALTIKWKGGLWLGWTNVLYAVLSFASIVGVFSFSLPLEIDYPELFPGLAIPMHFFPVLAFTTIRPFFKTIIN